MSGSKYKYRIYNGKVIKKILENSRVYFLAIFFSVGIAAGAAAINRGSPATERLAEIIDSFVILRSGRGIVENFCNSFAVNAPFVLAALFFGFSLIGYPFILWLPFLRGTGLGMVCGYLYSVYKLTGLGYGVLVIYPGAIAAVFAFVLACNDGCEYSKNAYAKAIKGGGKFEKNETRLYLVKQLALLLICAAASLIDAVFASIFSRFFEI